jgi:hypothetical protein
MWLNIDLATQPDKAGESSYEKYAERERGDRDGRDI